MNLPWCHVVLLLAGLQDSPSPALSIDHRNEVLALVSDEPITLRDILLEWQLERLANPALAELPPETRVRELLQERVRMRLWVDFARRSETLQQREVLNEAAFRQYAGDLFGELWTRTDVNKEFKDLMLRKAEENFSMWAILHTDPTFNRVSRARPDEIRDFYQENLERFHSPARIHLCRVTLPRSIYGTETVARTQEIRTVALAGGNLEEAARELAPGCFRDDGWKPLENSGLRTEILDFANSAQAGDLSGMIETPSAVFLYCLVERQEDRTLTFDEAAPRIRNLLQQTRRLEVADQLFLSQVLPEAYFQPADLFQDQPGVR